MKHVNLVIYKKKIGKFELGKQQKNNPFPT